MAEYVKTDAVNA